MLISSPVIGAEDLRAQSGWELKPEGLCKGELCVPIPAGSAGALDARVLAERLRMPLLHDEVTGVWALDMSNSHNPVHTASLLTPAMQSPHESLSLNVTRGLLAADMGYPTFQPGYVDIYDISQDCRSPVLRIPT